MNGRIFAALFITIFLSGAVPMLLVQPSGTSGALLAMGFVLPVESTYHPLVLVTIGVLSSWLGREAMVFLPLCALLMLVIGAMLQMDPHQFPALHWFLAGMIILFSLSVSMPRNKAFLLPIPPVALWAYLAGSLYMHQAPAVSAPLFFLLGTLISAASMVAIGVCLGVTLADSVREYMQRVKAFPAVTTFLSFF